ncbi:MAG: LysR family transcriptional regulator substrate-binding protein [Anaerolineaceae bacterium]|nr:LysR family transcriptional regulator substrate-binding protein [Anaerolineaceae bacterium]
MPYAEQIVNLKDQYSTILQNSLETDRELLTLGSIPALAQYNITDILVEFKKNCSQATINVTQFGTEELKDKLRQRKCELAFVCETDEEDDDIEKYLYMMDELVVVLPIWHPLAKEENIPLATIKNEDFILMEKQTKPHKLSLIACQQSGFEPKIAHTDNKLETILDLVEKGLGVALLMKRLAQCIFNEQICVVDISPKVYAQINLCYLKNGELSDAAYEFIECVKSQQAKANLPRIIGVPTQTFYKD